MCGLFGFSSAAPLDNNALALLHSAAQLLQHRGPDDQGIYVNESRTVGFAHTRLSIQDTSDLGHQPMSSPDGTVTIVFNGEIYNFEELRLNLLRTGYHFVGHSDTEVLLALYTSLRDKSDLTSLLAVLNGIFAIAIWDAALNVTWIIRDSMGVKPLYYTLYNGVFYFASELKAFHALSGLSLNPSPSAINQYLTYLWSPGSLTAADKIYKAEPGEIIAISNATIISQRSWISSHAVYLPHNRPNIDYINSLQNHLRSAVHRQMISDVPVGAFLSGGLDSSAIVAFAREVKPDIQCFTIDVRMLGSEGFSDDLPYAQDVAKNLGVPLHVVQIDSSQMAADLDHMIWHLDEPLADLAPLNVFYISRLARQLGLKVLLSGAGGDDLFSGYRRHLALTTERLWRWLPRPLLLRLRGLTGHLPADHSLFRRLRKVFSGAHLVGDARLVHYFSWIERLDLEALYTPAFRFELAQHRASRPMIDFLSTLPSGTSDFEKMLALEKRFFLPDHNLTYTDKMSMAVGVESRVPFLDPDLLRFASTVPPSLKQRFGQNKWILKRAMHPYLPRRVIYRPKTGFGVPLRRWMRVELHDWLSDALSVDRLQRRGMFDPLSVQRLLAANSAGSIDASYTLFSLACIETWCKIFIDRSLPSPQPASYF